MTRPHALPLCLITLLTALSLSGCSHPSKRYWQRTNPSQSVYMQGPKVQQMLDRDIQSCVNELNELERLHQVEDPIPTTYDGYLKEANPSTLYQIKTQGGDNALFSGSDSYASFDGCMYAKGWERVKILPYNTNGALKQTPRRERPDPATMRDIPRPPQYDYDTTKYRTMND